MINFLIQFVKCLLSETTVGSDISSAEKENLVFYGSWCQQKNL